MKASLASGMVSTKGIHLWRAWAPVSKTMPRGRSLGRPLEPWGQGWGFCRGSLGAQASSLARGGPTPSLDPRRTPASSDRRPSASMGLGNKGPGCEQLAYVAANPQPPPSRPHHCEDPPVLPSVKGSPFLYGWKNRGEAPRRWLSSEPRLLSLGPRSGAAHARAGPLTTSLSAGNGPRP